MKVAIINYGMGNLASVRRAFEDLGSAPFITNDSSSLYEADRVVLPGVGAFGEGMKCLQDGGWVEAITDIAKKRKPLLGICLGMQMLASIGHEGGSTEGLGLIPGTISNLELLGCKLRVPHIGWNEINLHESDSILTGIPEKSDFYFVHSFAFVPDSSSHLIATAEYGVDVAAIVRNKNIIGCQFHPEKSSKAGKQLLKNFLEMQTC